MSYADYQVEREAVAATLNAGTLTVTPGYSPITLRAVSIVVTTTTATADITFNINKRDPAGGAETLIDTIVVPNGTAAGEAVYNHDLEELILPGEDIFIEGQGGTGTGAGVITAFFEPCWDNPGSNTNMIESA